MFTQDGMFCLFIVLMKFAFIFASYNSKYWVLVIYCKYRVIIFFISFSRNGFLQMVMRKLRLFWNLYHQPRDQRKQKTALFIMTKQREGKRKKKKKRGCCCSVISYWTSVCQKSKQIDLFAILRKRFCLHEFSDSGHKIRNRNFINIPNLRKLFFICLKYIWDVLNTKSSISSDTGKGSQFWAVSQTWAVFRVDFSINSQMIEETTRLGRKRRKRYNKNKIIHHWRQD